MTSPLASRHYLFFRPLAHRHQRALGVRPDGPTVSHGRAELRRVLMAIVNDTWDNGIYSGVVRIPSIIAPDSQIYLTKLTAVTAARVKQTPMLFVWLKADSIMPFRTKTAVYAVAFAFVSAPGHHLLDLAWLFTRFQDLHTREGDYQRFNLVNVAYMISPRGTYGVLLFDGGLHTAYRQAEVTYISPLHHVPVSVWPIDTDTSEIRSDDHVSVLLSRAVKLASL